MSIGDSVRVWSFVVGVMVGYNVMGCSVVCCMFVSGVRYCE